MDTKIVTIDLGDRSYEIYIGKNIVLRIDDFLPLSVKGKKCYLVTDVNAKQYAEVLKDALDELDPETCEIRTLPAGESTKSYEHLQQVHNWMLASHIHRDSIVFAVGGGVIGDLGGFAASTVMRGVPYVQIPTTLLSQVDSSVGGKTGINTSHGKNLIGSFYQPIVVIADILTLETLPKRELIAGYAEIVKYGLIDDYEFFEWLEENGQEILDLDPFALATAIEVSCKAKAAIVQADEREGGKRALLNLGHTFAHALEAAAKYDGTLLHGEAVSIGMVMAFDLSVRMGLCDSDDLDRVRNHLIESGLPVDAQNIETDVDYLMTVMRGDKKVSGGKMTFILVNGIGDSFITQDVKEDDVRSLLAEYIA